jgi:hypothetical protein
MPPKNEDAPRGGDTMFETLDRRTTLIHGITACPMRLCRSGLDSTNRSQEG